MSLLDHTPAVMQAALVTWRVVAEFSISAALHKNSDISGASSVRRQSCTRISNRCFDNPSKLTQAPTGMLMQEDSHRRRGFSWPVCVSSPKSGETDSEEPSDKESPGRLTKDGGVIGVILEEARRQAAAALSTSAIALGSSLETTPSPEMRLDSTEEDAMLGDVQLPRSFLGESVDGNLVECGGRGCRSLYMNVLAEFFQFTDSGGSRKEVDTSTVKDAFLAALASAPHDARLVSEYAKFTWTSLGDVAAAEELFKKALELAPEDPDILASHALFLWNRDD